MLSVVVVGRNDNHGYNLGKRVASSLNSISMRLRDGDELIFVDWNTPRPFPPMPVSIIDDLTEQTKKFLRILAVDPKVHDEVKGVSSKMILEPIARNVGIRRAKIQNKWILSTNTDILFIGEDDLSFQDLIGQLDDRLWQSFRYEVPEYVWEVLDKRNPKLTNSVIRELSENTPIMLDLTTTPTEDDSENLIFADAIGDFQLAPREMWGLVKGFPEDMLNGWHVDSRAAVQMIRTTGKDSKILPTGFGLRTFHQNHLRSLTHFHSNTTMNSGALISEPYENKANWGMRETEISDYFLQDFMENLSKFKFHSTKKIEASHLQSAHKNNFYNVDRTLLFLMDELNGLKPNDQLTLISANDSLIEKITLIAKSLEVKVETAKSLISLGAVLESLAKSDLVILDFGVDDTLLDSRAQALSAGWIALELPQIAKMIKPNTRVALIRAQNWAIRGLARKFFSVPLFNNYSAILSGINKSPHPKLTFSEKTILLNGIRFDYGLPNKMPFLLNLIFHILRKSLPIKVRAAIRKMLIK